MDAWAPDIQQLVLWYSTAYRLANVVLTCCESVMKPVFLDHRLQPNHSNSCERRVWSWHHIFSHAKTNIFTLTMSAWEIPVLHSSWRMKADRISSTLGLIFQEAYFFAANHDYHCNIFRVQLKVICIQVHDDNILVSPRWMHHSQPVLILMQRSQVIFFSMSQQAVLEQWEEAYDEDSRRTYFFNTNTGESAWKVRSYTWSLNSVHARFAVS